MTKVQKIIERLAFNVFFYVTGLIFIIANSIRYRLFGYRNPRPFSSKEIERAINYDFNVAENWIKHLLQHEQQDSNFLKGKVILELGPGPDLGTGLILLCLGVKKYIALDVNGLAKSAPAELYQSLFKNLKKKYSNNNLSYLQVALSKCLKGEPSSLEYIVDKDFRITNIKDTIDIVFSQASFEHFDNVEKVIKEISSIVAHDGVMVSEIDLQTHTRWLRDRDPLNVYRYNRFLWDLFKFKGALNRARMTDYKDILTRHGWHGINILPLKTAEDKYFRKALSSINKEFRHIPSEEMKILNAVLVAKKG